MQEQYIAALKMKLAADARIKAAWLEGSLGRGNADRYSDLDIHLLLAEAVLPDFKTQVEAWLTEIRPLVLFNLLFDGKMVNALTQDGLRLDMWLHSGETMAVDPAKVLVLQATPSSLTFDKAVPPQDPIAIARGLERVTKEFWRCISLTPAVTGRAELIIGFIGLSVEINLLTELLLTGHGIVRDTGVKNLNHFLPADTRQAIEAALTLDGLSQASLVQAHLSLARIVQTEGRTIAEKHQFAYPDALEAAVLRYVGQELAQLGLGDQVDAR